MGREGGCEWGGGGGGVGGRIKESFVIMAMYYLLHFAYCVMCSVFREFFGVINDRYLNNQCRVQSFSSVL